MEHAAPHPMLVGETVVDAEITCVITRFVLRSPLSLLRMLRENRRLVRVAGATAGLGLLRSAFVIESPRVCFSLSIWSGEPLMSGRVEQHIEAARRVFPRLAYAEGRGPELWSTQWRLVSTTNNLNWGDFNLRSLIAAGAPHAA
jgi:hypothetical protein